AGGVRSTVMSAVAVAWRPARSVATAFRARSPSAGSGQGAFHGAEVATPSESHVPVEQPGLVSEQAKSSTWATPLPVSAAAAVTSSGSGEARFTYEPSAGDEIETVGGLLSTRTFA